MNKAEEQYLYQKHWHEAKSRILQWGWDNRNTRNKTLSIYLKEYIQSRYHKDMPNGTIEFYDSILRLIENNVITDWPSFVTHMTGETYER